MIPAAFIRIDKVGYAFHQHAVLLQHVTGKIEALALFCLDASKCLSGILYETFYELANAAFAAFLRHHTDAWDAFHLLHSIGRTGGNAHFGEQVEAVDVVADIGYLAEGDAQLVADFLGCSHLTAIALALAEVVELQLLGTVFYDMGVLAGDDASLDACLAEQLEAHAVAGVELLLLVARLGIVHAAVGQCAIDIAKEELDLRLSLLTLGEDMTLHEAFEDGPVIWFVDLGSGVFWHLIDTYLSAETIARIQNVLNYVDIEGTVLHQHAGEVLSAGAVHVVVVHRRAVLVPEETVVADAGQDAVVLSLAVHLQGLREVDVLSQRRCGLHEHEDVFLWQLGIVDVFQHHALCTGRIAGILGRTAIERDILVVASFNDIPDVIGVGGHNDLIHKVAGFQSLDVPAYQGLPTEELDVLERNGLRSSPNGNECDYFLIVYHFT